MLPTVLRRKDEAAVSAVRGAFINRKASAHCRWPLCEQHQADFSILGEGVSGKERHNGVAMKSTLMSLRCSAARGLRRYEKFINGVLISRGARRPIARPVASRPLPQITRAGSGAVCRNIDNTVALFAAGDLRLLKCS